MPSAFETSIAANLDLLYLQFGLTATYSPPRDGTATSGITIRLHRGGFREVPRDVKASGQLQTGEILVRQSELSKPEKGGRFMVENVEVWTIENIPTLNNGQFACVCSRSGTERMMERRAKE
jgi:hypothetical protein